MPESKAVYWIDTDPGLDDALAVLLALRSVGGRVVGLSTVHGNGEEPLVANNLLRVLSEFERADILPHVWTPIIARGAQVPIMGREVARGYAYHGEDCLGGLPWLVTSGWSAQVSPAPAAVAMLDATRRWSGNLHLVCLGPLTNLALALRLDPTLVEHVASLTAMGGSLRAGGNETLAAEFNFVSDAEAAAIVLGARWRTLNLVPIDVCDEARIRQLDLERLEGLGTSAARVARDLLLYFDRLVMSQRGAPFYDPTAWLLLMHPELAVWEDVYVAVDASGGVAHGASLVDWRRRARRAPNVRAATGLLDAAWFIDVFLDVLT
ncbi:MAG: nucleoside hydrolase [Chloroflexota bacterium]